MLSSKLAATMGAVAVLAGTALVSAETRREYRFTVQQNASISITNQFGPITVTTGAGNQVVITAITSSGKVEVDQGQRGDRIDVVSHLLAGADADSGRVEYEAVVPPDASVSLRSATGPMYAEKLRNDVTVEGATANVEVRDISGAHVHIKTLDGPVILSNIRDGHIEVNSVGGDVRLTAVSGPLVQVSSGSGKIHYDGDFGAGGQYTLRSHTGDIEALAPAYASIDVIAHSEKGLVENDFPLEPEHTSFVVKAGSAFAGTVGKAASKVKLFSFSGKIHLKKH
jgi:DUF4097 and DUF4098 domain-containing protein YvlB